MLDSTGLKNIVVVGYQLHLAVVGTARTAYDMGFQLAVPKDCVGVKDHVLGVPGEDIKRAEFAVLGDLLATILEGGADVKG